jgi:hypothetical protein
MRDNSDNNSNGFLALILIGIVLVVIGLFMMGDAARSDRSSQLAEQQQPTMQLSRIDEPRPARF